MDSDGVTNINLEPVYSIRIKVSFTNMYTFMYNINTFTKCILHDVALLPGAQGQQNRHWAPKNLP